MGKHKTNLTADEYDDFASPEELAWARQIFYSRSAGTMTLVDLIEFKRAWTREVHRLNPKYWEREDKR